MTVAPARYAEHRQMPWQNGLGTTREVARHPADGAVGWRVSIAEVARDSDFSVLPGLDRVIVPCDEAGMRLTVDGVTHDLPAYRPFRFAGEAATSCRVDRPARDLNVMTRRGVYAADVAVRPGGGPVAGRAGEVTFVVPLTGSCTAAGDGLSGTVVLGALDALRLDAGDRCDLDGAGRLAVVRIRRLG